MLTHKLAPSFPKSVVGISLTARRIQRPDVIFFFSLGGIVA